MKNNQTLRQFLGIKVEKGKPFSIRHKGREVYVEYASGSWWKYEHDAEGREIYHENYSGLWWKREYDSRGNITYYENSEGYWWKSKYDSNDRQTYHEDAYGAWWKCEYDSKGNQIYYEDSTGFIYDIRFKEISMDEIAEKFGIPVSQLKIKKINNHVKRPNYLSVFEY